MLLQPFSLHLWIQSQGPVLGAALLEDHSQMKLPDILFSPEFLYQWLSCCRIRLAAFPDELGECKGCKWFLVDLAGLNSRLLETL